MRTKSRAQEKQTGRKRGAQPASTARSEGGARAKSNPVAAERSRPTARPTVGGLTAADVMQPGVVSVSPETPLAAVFELFSAEQIHGAPVLDNAERIVGVISASDLLRAVAEERDTAAVESNYLRELVEFSAPDWRGGLDDFQDRLAMRCVAEVMTPSAVTVARDASVAEVARRLREHAVHRLWVVEDGRLCGVISTFDLLPVVEKLAAPAEAPRAPAPPAAAKRPVMR